MYSAHVPHHIYVFRMRDCMAIVVLSQCSYVCLSHGNPLFQFQFLKRFTYENENMLGHFVIQSITETYCMYV